MKLLIIDDDAVDRMSIAKTIHAARVSSEIAEAATALEGLNALTQREFDAVLLDYRLPDMDCLDALHAINRTATHNVAVIVLTGGPAEEELGCRCIEAGAQDFVPDDEGSTLFITDPTDLDAVCKALPEQGFTVNSAKLGYRPKNPVSSLTPEQMEEVEAFLEAIDGHDDVQNVYVGLAG